MQAPRTQGTLLMAPCTKIPYQSPADAKRALSIIRKRGRRSGSPKVPRDIHPCGECHAWHITSQKGWSARARRVALPAG